MKKYVKTWAQIQKHQKSLKFRHNRCPGRTQVSHFGQCQYTAKESQKIPLIPISTALIIITSNIYIIINNKAEK